jgi:hypothetical protein
MLNIHHDLNVVAICVCAAGLWVLGALWYSPMLFGKSWMALAGMPKAEGKRPGMLLAMTASLIGDFVVALILEHFVIWSGAGTFGWGALIGFISWAGFVGATTLPQSMYEQKPFKLFASGYWILGMTLVGGVLAIWK